MDLCFRKYGSPGDAASFRSLNEEWILAHFALEPRDREVLGNPRRSILDAGGQVYFLQEGGEVIGCVALIPTEQGVVELSKMALAPKARGQGLGRRLLQHAIEEARRMGAAQVILGTHSKLAAALHLYRQAGFESIPLGHPGSLGYQRAEIFMRLTLQPEAITPRMSNGHDHD